MKDFEIYDSLSYRGLVNRLSKTSFIPYARRFCLFRRGGIFNPKRKIQKDFDQEWLESLQKKVKYGGNPEHKKHPGDFGLTPPAMARPDKTLCDGVEIFKKTVALRRLKEGIKYGLVSEQMRGDYPQNVWAITKNGEVLEAQLENEEQGIYHGYPMPCEDPFKKVVLSLWYERRKQTRIQN